MRLDFRTRHKLEQFGGVAREVGHQVAAYQRTLIEGGMERGEAFELAMRLDDRLMGPLIESLRAELKDDRGGSGADTHIPDPWERP